MPPFIECGALYFARVSQLVCGSPTTSICASYNWRMLNPIDFKKLGTVIKVILIHYVY